MPTKKPAPRRKGPAPRLNEPVKFSTQLEARHRDALFAYAASKGISVAEATRKAVEMLTGGK